MRSEWECSGLSEREQGRVARRPRVGWLTCVTLSRNKKLAIGKVRKLLKKVENGLQVVLCGLQITGVVITTIVAVRKSDARRRFNPQHVCHQIPTSGAQFSGAGVALHNEGTVLSEHTAQAAAARATVEPQHDGVGRGVSLTLSEPVEEIAAMRCVNIKVACVVLQLA